MSGSAHSINGAIFSLCWSPCTLRRTRRALPWGFTGICTILVIWPWVTLPGSSTNLFLWYIQQIKTNLKTKLNILSPLFLFLYTGFLSHPTNCPPLWIKCKNYNYNKYFLILGICLRFLESMARSLAVSCPIFSLVKLIPNKTKLLMINIDNIHHKVQN